MAWFLAGAFWGIGVGMLLLFLISRRYLQELHERVSHVESAIESRPIDSNQAGANKGLDTFSHDVFANIASELEADEDDDTPKVIH